MSTQQSEYNNNTFRGSGTWIFKCRGGAFFGRRLILKPYNGVCPHKTHKSPVCILRVHEKVDHLVRFIMDSGGCPSFPQWQVARVATGCWNNEWRERSRSGRRKAGQPSGGGNDNGEATWRHNGTAGRSYYSTPIADSGDDVVGEVCPIFFNLATHFLTMRGRGILPGL